MFAGFFIGIKTPFYAPIRNKKGCNSVRTKWIILRAELLIIN